MKKSKRIIGVIGTGLLLAVTLLSARPVTEEVEVVETIQPKEIHYLTDQELSRLYSCKQDIRKTDPNIIEVDYYEALALLRIAEAEHGNGSPEAQANVMKTVINRVSSEEFPDSIIAVIYQKTNGRLQFSTVANGSYDKAVPDADTHYGLAMLEQGQINHNALYFVASYVEGSWISQNKTFLFEQEGHRFYR